MSHQNNTSASAPPSMSHFRTHCGPQGKKTQSVLPSLVRIKKKQTLLFSVNMKAKPWLQLGSLPQRGPDWSAHTMSLGLSRMEQKNAVLSPMVKYEWAAPFFLAWTCYTNEAPWVEIISDPEERLGGGGGCSHRWSVHYPVRSLLALKHHAVRLLPLLCRPEEEEYINTRMETQL